MAGGYGESRSLEFTPTWALTTVATIFVVISFVVERSLHWLLHYLHRKKRKAMFHALEKIRDELMLVGFISLTLTMLQEPISKICIKSSYYKNWAPCKMDAYYEMKDETKTQKFHIPRPSDFSSVTIEEHGRRRLLAAGSTSTCKEGYEPFVSYDSLHYLHIFLFVLAVIHVLYTFIIMGLALLKVYSWKRWEVEAHKVASDGMAELVVNNISYTRQSTFMRYHTSKPWSRSRIIVWVVCFFQQFHIPQADYLTLRFSFITTHNLPLCYNFHDYMMRSMEDEFETIVGISAWLWAFVAIFLLFNVQGINLYFWTSFIPVVAIIAIGTKLQHVVATLAMESNGALPFPGPFVGAQLKPRDELFWFHRPRILVHIIHLVLFQDAFEMSMFIWQVWKFGWNSCMLEENKWFAYTRLFLGVITLLFVSFSTLPLFALVSQMGSSYKKAVVPPRVNHALHVWHKDAKKRLKKGDRTPREHLISKDEHDDTSNVSSPVTSAMEEGSEIRKTRIWDVDEDKQPPNPSVAIVAQNVWDRRLIQTSSGKSKTLYPIDQKMGNVESRRSHGFSPSTTPGSSSELRRRISPNDPTPPTPRPLQGSNNPKPPLP